MEGEETRRKTQLNLNGAMKMWKNKKMEKPEIKIQQTEEVFRIAVE